MFAGAEVAANTAFVDMAIGIHYYGSPSTASDAPTEIMKESGLIGSQGIVLKSGSTTTMGRGLMVFINRWGIATKWKGPNWDEDWTYLVTL